MLELLKSLRPLDYLYILTKYSVALHTQKRSLACRCLPVVVFLFGADLAEVLRFLQLHV